MAKYIFTPSPLDEGADFHSKAAVEARKKWDLSNASFNTFSFGERFEESDAERFLLELWNSPSVRSTVELATRDRTLEAIPPVEAAAATSVRWSRVPTTALRMDLFDPILAEGIIRPETSRIAGCVPERVDGVEADDRLRALMVNEDAEDYLVMGGAQRSELLFRVAQLLVIGGSMCQKEDDWSVYAPCVKGLYKDLLTVHKASSAGGIHVASAVFAVSAIEGLALFPEDSPHSHCIVSVDPLRRRVHILYSAFVNYW